MENALNETNLQSELIRTKCALVLRENAALHHCELNKSKGVRIIRNSWIHQVAFSFVIRPFEKGVFNIKPLISKYLRTLKNVPNWRKINWFFKGIINILSKMHSFSAKIITQHHKMERKLSRMQRTLWIILSSLIYHQIRHKSHYFPIIANH